MIRSAARAGRPILVVLFAAAARADVHDEPAPGPFSAAIAAAQARVVKVYGASVGREPGYASGVIVAADGQIVTALSVMLEARNLRVVLPDGRVLPATVQRRDPRRQLALLKVDAEALPFFEIGDSRTVSPGDWVIAAANPFKVADGPEPVSVSLGVLGGRTQLSARRRAQDFPYRGEVLLTDLVVATPGSAGGAIVDVHGRLLGVIGRPVISNLTNTWVNYALPAEELAAFLAGAPTSQQAPAAGEATATADLGFRVFNVGGRSRPAYVERVRPGSAARRAGLRVDDLILSINGVATPSCDEFAKAAAALQPGVEAELVVKRSDQILTIVFTVEAAEP